MQGKKRGEKAPNGITKLSVMIHFTEVKFWGVAVGDISSEFVGENCCSEKSRTSKRILKIVLKLLNYREQNRLETLTERKKKAPIRFEKNHLCHY